MATEKQVTVLCSVCATELKVIPDSNSRGYGWCKTCNCWQPGVA
ncbi:hypothetical protein SEA_SHAGRAT_85 [Rhodococcus phage Shagrat]|nr:hypothetical protein SEA_SHAGRAT_85 [Rhodococcus phage Shagrat]